jgi:tetratricopeptide (TPR) repeat protein
MDVYEHPDKSIELGLKILKEAKNSEQKVSALLLISTAYSSKRDYENSLNYALKAKDVAESNSNILDQLKVMNKIAAQYHQMRVNDKALQYLDEFDRVLEKYRYKDSAKMILGNSLALRGFIYRDKLNCEIAIDYFNNAIRKYEIEESSITRANRSVILYNKANCFISLNQIDSAKTTFLKSIELAKKAGAKSLEAFSHKGLAETFTLEGKYETALSELNKAIEISKDVGDLVLNQGIYKGLSDNYLAVNNWEKHQGFYKKYNSTVEQIKKTERNSISISLKNHLKETQFEIQKTKKRYGAGILVVSVLILILISNLVNSQRKSRQKIRNLKLNLYKK